MSRFDSFSMLFLNFYDPSHADDVLLYPQTDFTLTSQLIVGWFPVQIRHMEAL